MGIGERGSMCQHQSSAGSGHRPSRGCCLPVGGAASLLVLTVLHLHHFTHGSLSRRAPHRRQALRELPGEVGGASKMGRGARGEHVGRSLRRGLDGLLQALPSPVRASRRGGSQVWGRHLGYDDRKLTRGFGFVPVL